LNTALAFALLALLNVACGDASSITYNALNDLADAADVTNGDDATDVKDRIDAVDLTETGDTPQVDATNAIDTTDAIDATEVADATDVVDATDVANATNADAMDADATDADAIDSDAIDADAIDADAIAALGPELVLLGLAEDYVILASSGVTNIPNSTVIGNLGVSPINSTAITGFVLVMDLSGQFSTAIQVTGQVRAANYANPTPEDLITTVGDMQAAFADAASRTTPDFVGLGGGEIGSLTLSPGLYNWTTALSITTDVILDGGPDDVWIFQIAGAVTQAAGAQVLLTGGASANNIFWEVAGAVTLGANAHLEGIVLGQTSIALGAGASVNGRILAQTAVTLNHNAVSQPTP